MNPATQKQALIAGARTFLQTFRSTLLVVTGGGGLLAAITDINDVPWIALGGALAAGILVAFFAGLDSYLNFTINGIPTAYTVATPADTTTGD